LNGQEKVIFFLVFALILQKFYFLLFFLCKFLYFAFYFYLLCSWICILIEKVRLQAPNRGSIAEKWAQILALAAVCAPLFLAGGSFSAPPAPPSVAQAH
jgi:hypothetical protein